MEAAGGTAHGRARRYRGHRGRALRRALGAVGFVAIAALVALLVWQRWSQVEGPGASGAVRTPPTFGGAFTGGPEPLVRPVGVLAWKGRVFVTDARAGAVRVFDADGAPLETWGAGRLSVPVGIARHPGSGDLYVSDRASAAVFVFDHAGRFKGVFAPDIPRAAGEEPTSAAAWSPVALDFGADGTLVVADVGEQHRLLVFGPDGRFVAQAGAPGAVANAASDGGLLRYPTAVRLRGSEIWVADSNNRRIQLFGTDGLFRRLIVTNGLPRGFAFASAGPTESVAYVVDTVGQRLAMWDVRSGTRLNETGALGTGPGEFMYPNGVAVSDDGRIYVADTGNARVQIWRTHPGAGAEDALDRAISPAPWLLAPMAAALAWWSLRRPRYFVTADFIGALSDLCELQRLTTARVRWECLAEDRGLVHGLEWQGVRIPDILHPVQGAEPDVRAFRERYLLQEREAQVMAAARRARVLCTNDRDLARVAGLVGLPVEDHAAFLERVTAKERLAV